MTLLAAITPAVHSTALASAELLGAAGGGSHALVHLLISLGILGVFLVSIVDSSFIPLPVPGLTDIMVILFAAQHTSNVFLLVGVATLGSALGGLFSHQVGQSGGMAFLEKHISPRAFKRVCEWMEHHAILSVALPAVLPPPMPLSPFVLAAGALHMPRRKFLWTFTISRMLRHTAAAWLGVHYGKQVVHFWNRFSAQWGTTILVVVWGGIAISLTFAFWQLWKSCRILKAEKAEQPKPARAAA